MLPTQTSDGGRIPRAQHDGRSSPRDELANLVPRLTRHTRLVVTATSSPPSLVTAYEPPEYARLAIQPP